MFEGEKKRNPKPGPLQRNRTYREISPTVLVSCYVASAANIALSVSEALRCFSETDSGNGTFYVVLAVLGLFFSVFITIMNNRNKRILAQQKNLKKKK